MTINGSNFEPTPADDLVSFQGIAGQAVSASTTTLNASVPSLARTGHISVTTINGEATTSGYFFVPPPPATVSSISATSQLTIGGPATTVTTSPAGSQALIAFDGTAGQQVALEVSNDSYPSYDSSTIYIQDPNGNEIASHGEFNGNFTLSDVNLPSTGTYVIFVDPAANDTGGMTLQLFDSTNDFAGTMSIGGPAVTETTTVGQDAVLTFDGTAGQQIALNITSDTYPSYDASTLQILDPTGKVIASHGEFNGNFTLSDVNLTATGTYTISVDPAGADTGSLTLQLFDSTNDFTGTMSIGGPAVTETTTVGQDAVLTFDGTAGQQVALNITSDTYPSYDTSTLQILDPTGKVIASHQGFNGNFTLSDVNLTATGTYTISVDPAGADTGGLTLQLWNLSDESSTVNVSDTYAQTILGDSPQTYWRLDESGPTTVVNAAPAIKYGVPGPTTADTAIDLNNGVSYISTSTQVTNPTTYSVEIWFKTTTQTGGRLIGFESSETGSSSNYDRQIYMTNSGQLIFGQYAGGFKYITSSASYNDGNWHQVVGTYDGSTMVLYVDGVQVGSTSAGAPQHYNGYWRIGYGDFGNWPSKPTSYYFNGSLGEAAVWNSTALTSAQVSNEFSAASNGNYDSVVLADSPSSYWKLNESSGPTFADATGGGNNGAGQAKSDNGLYVGGVTLSQPGAISGDDAITLDGSSGYVAGLLSYTNPGPFSVAVWFKTTTTAGGLLIGFGDHQTGSSSNYDRHIYMTNSGRLVFGTCCSVTTVETTGTYNDGNWHYAVGTWANNTLSFYVDGSLIGTATGNVQSYTGYWRLGYDKLNGWPSPPSSYYFEGTIDEAAVYDYALTAAQITNHYSASGR